MQNSLENLKNQQKRDFLELKEDIEGCKMVIRKFDETITLKADKIALRDFQKFCDRTYESKDVLQAQMAQLTAKIQAK